MPDLTFFPWLSQEFPPGTLRLEAESAPLASDYGVFENPAATERLYVRSRVSRNAEPMRYAFRVPPGPGGASEAPRAYRFFARVWKPYADLLNVSVDDGPAVTAGQVHDMDGNTYPVWSVGTSLGDDAVVRYWQDPTPGRPAKYSAKYLVAEGLLGVR